MSSANENQLLDPINRRLLQELQADARVTMAELGRRINSPRLRWVSASSGSSAPG